MAFDAHKNFATSTVATAPSPASSGTSLTVAAGEGSRFPAVPFEASVYPANSQPTPANAEVVRVTARATDTLTIVRTQETSSARTIVVGDVIVASITAKALTDVEQSFPTQTFRGLQLRTHPDSDQAANKVALVAADEIVMDDGYRYSGLTLPLAADITASGAGGLDTGTRTASKWYEVYAIGKRSTLAVSDLRLLLHRAKERPLDQSQTTDNGNDDAGIRNATTTQRRAQRFTPGTSGAVEKVHLRLRRNGSPTGNVWLQIEADSAGAPSGTALATSDKFDVTKVGSTAQEIAFIFRTPATLTASTNYWIVIYGDFTISGTNYLSFGYNSGTAGTLGFYNGSTWDLTAAAVAWFKEFVTVTNGTPTLPSGYDQTCRIGFVYNNGSNVLVPFIAHDRLVAPLTGATGNVGSYTSTVPALTDLSSFVPPGRVIAWLSIGHSAAGGYVEVAGLPDGFVGSSAQRVGGQAWTYAPGALAQGSSAPLWIATDFQACYVSTGSSTGYVECAGFTW